MKSTTVFDCELIKLSKNHSENGNITAVNNFEEIPFEVRRVYYLYDVPGGECRGGHAHKELKQLIVAVSGSFDLIVDDGKMKQTFQLNRSFNAVIIPPGLWRELENFSNGSICLVLASCEYDENDYLREYSSFLSYKA